MPAAPAIPLFGDSYLADTRHLSLEEHGAYLQLLMIAWRSEGCCLPDDDRRLAQMLGISASKWAKIKGSVMSFWTLENGSWSQGRLLKERRFVDEKRAKNREAAKGRWNSQPAENKGNEGCERISERYAPPPPPNKEENKEEVGGAAAPGGKYAFEGSTIRLSRPHLEQWRSTFNGIADLMAELVSLDAWWADQPEEKRKKWFHPTAGMLNRKHQEILEKRAEAKRYDDRITV